MSLDDNDFRMFDHALGKINETLKEIGNSIDSLELNLSDPEHTYDRRRERIAAACLAALLADSAITGLKELALAAVQYADALLAALDEPTAVPKTAVITEGEVKAVQTSRKKKK